MNPDDTKTILAAIADVSKKLGDRIADAEAALTERMADSDHSLAKITADGFARVEATLRRIDAEVGVVRFDLAAYRMETRARITALEEKQP